jgi:alpha-aminoadipate/glutamate carrier protein LysW
MPNTCKCPKCDANISLSDDCEVGEIILCDECSAELEVKKLDPEPVLDDAPAVEEDWGE